MTQSRCTCPRGALRNYFARLIEGIGPRGCSFSDIDAITHDKETGRFLVQEFKYGSERDNEPQYWMLRDLARLRLPDVSPDNVTVWIAVKYDEHTIGLTVITPARSAEQLTVGQYRERYEEIISDDEYRECYRAWWFPPQLSLATAIRRVHV